MHTAPRAAFLAVAGVLALALPHAASAGDPASDLKSADPLVRLSAVDAIRSGQVADSEALLVSALSDKDYEVAERAAQALEKKGGAAAAKALGKTAADHPSRKIRVTAARSLAQLAEWADGLEPLARADVESLADACDAAGAIALVRESEALVKLMDRGLGTKKAPEARAPAAALVVAHPAAARAAALREFVKDPDLTVACGALDAVRMKPDDATTAVLSDLLVQKTLHPVVDRRVRSAYASAVARKEKGDAAAAAASGLLSKTGDAALAPAAAARMARAIGEIAEIPDGHVAPEKLLEALLPLQNHADAQVRGAAAASLGKVGGDTAHGRAAELAQKDADARVRLIALRSAASIRPAESNDATFRMLVDVLGRDADAAVREEAAVALGRKKLQGAVPSLERAAQKAMEAKDNAEWAVAACALVSMGKTRDPAAVDSLAGFVAKAKDWKVRGAAVTGLGHVQDVRAIPHLIEAMAAKEAPVRNVAFEFLRRLTSEKVEPKQASWKAWWAKNAPSYVFVDREEEARKAKKYGYSTEIPAVYEGLDVQVFTSRGDSIENLLKKLSIDHRLTRSGNILNDGPEPLGIFISNCTGEIVVKKDAEPLQWFVKTGGYLFGSCWALSETIEPVAPGFVRKFDTKQEVLKNVTATPCRPWSPFLDGVYPDLVQPIYVLYGAHLIDVLDPDRVEVLVDSPATAQGFGCGDLAAWFTTGHGLILDSANHFDRQGFNHADNLKTDADRIAFAADHLGLSWKEIRKIPPSAWASNGKAHEEAADTASFRFLTNFVKQKRREFN
ncbi:MAG: hypothetical protein HMLKMBBP_00742 [Planctomycetes bacterium]|nr:hypothetical protein [Planctomycetota bacterium]